MSTDFACWLRYCTDVAQRTSTKLCTMFGRLLGWYTILHFPGVFIAPKGILPGANFTLCPSLALSYIGSVTALHSSSERDQAKLCGVVQGMELRNFYRGRHLYSAGRPSRWPSAQILVLSVNLIPVQIRLPTSQLLGTHKYSLFIVAIAVLSSHTAKSRTVIS